MSVSTGIPSAETHLPLMDKADALDRILSHLIPSPLNGDWMTSNGWNTYRIATYSGALEVVARITPGSEWNDNNASAQFQVSSIRSVS